MNPGYMVSFILTYNEERFHFFLKPNPMERIDYLLARNRIWIAWETQRRSIELSKALQCTLFIIELNGPLRYPLSLLKTFLIFLKEKPSIIFVQNPSMILTAFTCFYRKIFNIPLVVDRHTTFLIDKPITTSLRRRIFLFLHYLTIRNADITLVTNDHLAYLVKQANGKSFVLPDPLPTLSPARKEKLYDGISFLVPCSFGEDEPIEQIMEAGRLLKKENIVFHITGNYRKFSRNNAEQMPANVILTGFLPEQGYVDLLFSVDAVMTLTMASNTMLCGCYEAVSAEKPLITSDKPDLKNYFYDALFTDNSAISIVKACLELVRHIDVYKDKSKKMKQHISKIWTEKLKELEKKLGRMC